MNLDGLEPAGRAAEADVGPTNAIQYSQAISLKRIADALEALVTVTTHPMMTVATDEPESAAAPEDTHTGDTAKPLSADRQGSK